MEKNHFEQAKLWLSGAEYIAGMNSENNNKYAVSIAMSIHAILKANDALKQIIQDAINTKSKAEYRGAYFSKMASEII